MSQRMSAGRGALGIAALVFAQWSYGEAAPPAHPIALKAAHLFDSLSGKLMEHGVVIVFGTKIQTVGSDAQIPADAVGVFQVN